MNRLRRPIRSLLTAAVVFAAVLAPDSGHAQELRTADLGACELESGETLSPCTVAYRTVGSLDPDRDNVVLVPTWFTGTSEQSVDYFASLVDTTAFHVILVDALGNGVSESPSTSPTQGGDAFPRISIGDMVATQHRLMTEALGLDRLHAVVGASMGGMQAFEWLVAHPGFLDRAVSLIGSPKLGPYDIALWETDLRLLDLYEACQCDAAAEALAGLSVLTGSSPSAVHARMAPGDVAGAIRSGAEAVHARRAGWTHDMASQLHAMIGHDVSRRFGGDMAAAAAAVRADLLSVVVRSDHVVTPWPAIDFTALAGGASIVLDNEGGHGGLFAPDADYAERVRAFLARDD